MQAKPGTAFHETGNASLDELLLDYYGSRRVISSRKLVFDGVSGYDVYNPTAPFSENGQRYLAARIEHRGGETDSYAGFFFDNNGAWRFDDDIGALRGQDPKVARIGSEWVVSVVDARPTFQAEGGLEWSQIFYRGGTLGTLRPFAKGPDLYKGIVIGVHGEQPFAFTRPMGGDFGNGRIGFRYIGSLDNLEDPAFLTDSEIIGGQFPGNIFGGANAAYSSGNGCIDVLCHVAFCEPVSSEQPEMNKHYYPGVFSWNPETKEASPVRVVASRADLLPGDSKRPGLYDVFYPGGLESVNGLTFLYGGVSDAEAQAAVITKPF